MSELVSTGASKVLEEMVEEAQAALKEQKTLHQPEPSQQFQEVLEGHRVAESQEVRPALDIAQLLRAAREAQSIPQVPAIGQAMDSRSGTMTGLQRIMEDVMQGQNKLDEIMNLALSGRNFSTPELLALQASVYRFTQELELTSKVVEKGTATVKQTMNTQV